jgi:predicted Zn-dependent protease
VGTDEHRPLGVAAEAMVRRAERLHGEGRHFAAALEWQAVVRLDPNDRRAALRWADACMRSGQHQRAAEAYLTAATALADARELGCAMVLARRAMQTDASAVIRPRIETIVRACGHPAEALAEAAARAHVDAGRFDAAVALRELLVECDPGSVTKTLSAAQLGLEHGDPARATGALVEAASRMHERGRTGEYVRIAETMLACGRHDPDTILELARIYLRRGQVSEAVAKLQLLRRTEPGRLEVVELLVRALASSGETAGAIAVLEEAMRRGAHDRDAVARLLARAEAFDGIDGGFRTAVRRLRDRPTTSRPPPPPAWASRGRSQPIGGSARSPSESSGVGWPG